MHGTSFFLLREIILFFFASIYYFISSNVMFAQEYKKVATWQKGKSAITRIQISSNELFLAAGDADGAVYLWDLKYNSFLKRFNVAPSAKITDIDFSQDNKFMSIASYDGFVQIFSIDSMTLIHKIELPKGENLEGIKGNEPFFARFDSQNSLYFGGLNMTLSYFDTSKNLTKFIYKFGGNGINCGSFSSNLKTLAVGVGAELYLFDTKSKTLINKIGKYNRFEDLICEVNEWSENEWLVWKMSGELFVANFEKLSFEKYMESSDALGSAQFAITDSLLVTGNFGLNVTLWDKFSRKKLQTLTQHTLPVRILSAGKAGNYLATGDSAKIYIWSKLKVPFLKKDTAKFISDSLELVSDMPLPKKNFMFTLPLYFEQGKANLKLESTPYLEKLLMYLRVYPNIKIALEGHTDNLGSRGGNLKLSILRAQTVAEYLTKRGIQKERISTQGFGGSKPIADNISPILRQKNRRVEMRILSE